MDLLKVGLGLLSYLAGGIPTGYVLARTLKGIDIREHGSGNPGAANVYRVVGRAAGAATLLVDALKGFLPVLLVRHCYPHDYTMQIVCGALAIIGHIWTIFLRFRGGKGVATSAGVFLALMPRPIGAALGVFAVAVAVTGHISVGSMSAALLFPFLALLFHEPAPLVYMAGAVGALVLIKHIPNLRRLLGGRELHYSHGSHLEKDQKRQ